MTRRKKIFLALCGAAFLAAHADAQTSGPSVRELIPATAPAGARMLVTGGGLSDESLTVSFTASAGYSDATIIRREARFLEVVVPPLATTGMVRVMRDGDLIGERSFTLAAPPAYTRLTTIAGGPHTGDSVFKEPYASAIDPSTGIIYVADSFNHRIRAVSPSGSVSTLAGSTSSGFANGSGAAARFKEPRGIAFDPAARLLYVADTGNNAIRRVALDGVVTTLAGSTSSGSADGTGTSARFKEPYGIAVDAAGTVFVADTFNHKIRRITPAGVVTTFAGAGSQGHADGSSSTARFNEPEALTVAGDAIYVGDTGNHVIRKIESGRVSTVAGRAGNSGSSDGSLTAARFNEPAGIAADEVGNLIVADTENSLIRKVDLIAGAVSRLAGTTADDFLDGAPLSAKLKEPTGLTFAGAAFITDSKNYALRALCSEARVTGIFIDGSSPAAGADVRLFGTGFVPGATTVSFDGVAASSVVWIASTTLRTTLPNTLTDNTVSVAISACGGSPAAQLFVIERGDEDTTAPAITITTPADGTVVAAPLVTISGTADDAQSITVNGVAATLDGETQTFTATITLMEGSNVVTATGTDPSGNTASASIGLVLDTRAPNLTVSTAVSCTRSEILELGGTVADPHLQHVSVQLGSLSVEATVSSGAWTATLPLGEEGRKSILITATDALGHSASRQVTLSVDRTPPLVEVTESGAPFDAAIFGRPVAPLIRVSDADASPVTTATLNGSPYISGTEIGAERSHTLRVVTRDCAGNEGTYEQTFTIDLTAPRFLTFDPPNEGRVAQIPDALRGTTDPDAKEVRVVGSTITAPVTNGSFVIANVGFGEGTNERTLELIDAAGHTTQVVYTLSVRSALPVIEITDGGEPIVEGRVYNRPLAPVIRVEGEGVSVTATLNNAPFTSGTVISADGSYTLSATATDSVYGQTAQLTRRFTIDRTAPVVQIVSPMEGDTIDADRVDVRLTAGDATRASVNDVAANRQTDGSWITSVPLDLGENTITATAFDGAGNTGSHTITVSRAAAGPAVVVTFPPDPYITNRKTIDVSGRVFRPGTSVTVTVPPAAPVSVAVDPAGMFRLTGAVLTEGDSTIRVSAVADGQSNIAESRVTADFTPPRVRIFAGSEPLVDNANFAVEAVLNGEATDGGQPIAYVLTVDGTAIATPHSITALGGHTAVITARDAAGNEARVERTFTIGSGGGSGCVLEGFDPADGSVITSQQVELVGRSGGAAGVKVNGIPARMASGSFGATVELPQEGANTVSIVCTDATGQPVGTPVAITLHRATSDPSITITTPLEDAATSEETITVSGTAGGGSGGSLSIDVNGKPATFDGSSWSVSGVRLQSGVNVIVATARTTGGRVARASRRITYLKEAPSIAITSPVPGFVTGAASLDVSGTWLHLDPGSIAVTGHSGAIETSIWSDTSGRFTVRDVPLLSGDTTIQVTGRDRLARLATASIVVRQTANAPTIAIEAPADNAYLSSATFSVSGSFAGQPGSQIDVNAVPATITDSTYSALLEFPASPGTSALPVVARLTEPGGGGAFATVRVYRLPAPPEVRDTFPAASAVEVDPGVAVLVSFSAPMDRASLTQAFRLESTNGTQVSGMLILDRDVLTFAPATTLTPGAQYTIRIGTAAKDLAGQSLSSAVTSSFFVATTASSTAPSVTTPSGAFCGNLIDVAGTTGPGGRLRIDYGSIFFTTTASATGAFSYKVPLSGQPGFHVIRVRSLGADGTLSPAAELKLDLDCAGPRVTQASFDRTLNRLTILFSREIKPPSASAFTLRLSSGGEVAASAALTNPTTVTLTPAENLTASTFTLTVGTSIEDLQGRPLDFPFTQIFSATGDDDLQPGDGEALIAGEVYDAHTGRPLPGVTIEFAGPQSGATGTTTDARGRYFVRVAEGAHTIRATLEGYTAVTRQVIVAAGTTQIPIDIRLEKKP
jgi:hypothetical protein